MLRCCKAHEKIDKKTENSTPCKIIAFGNFSSKLCTLDYLGDDNSHTNFDGNGRNGGFSASGSNITSLLYLTVLSCSVLLVFSFSRPSRTTESVFHTLWLKRRGSAQIESFSGLGQWATLFGGYAPKISFKIGANRQFQAKRQNLKIETNKFEDLRTMNSDHQLHFAGGLQCQYPQANPTRLTAAILKINMTS